MKVLRNTRTELVLESRSRWIWPATNMILIPAGAMWVYFRFFNDVLDGTLIAIAIGVTFACTHFFNLNVREELVLDQTAGTCTHTRMQNGRVKQNTIPLDAIETAGIDTFHPPRRPKKA